MKHETVEGDEVVKIEIQLAEALERLAKLRTVMHARRIAGLLSEDDLREFMEIDAQVEIVTRALHRNKH